MSTPTPRFIDINAPFEENPEPSWKRSWKGEELLWKVFWGWFLGGLGVILGSSIGFMVLAMILGFAVSPTSLNAGVLGLASGSALLVLTIVPYSFWISVSLWRCAPNCLSKKWSYAARGFVVIYGILILIPTLIIF
jgi:magnesium-transporting ATPase (P-type)